MHWALAPEADPSQLLHIVLTAQDPYPAPPSLGPPALTNQPGFRQADPTSQVKPATIPTPSALVQPASALASSQTPPFFLWQNKTLRYHRKIDSVQPCRGQGMSLPTVSFLHVLLLPWYTAKGFSKSLIWALNTAVEGGVILSSFLFEA